MTWNLKVWSPNRATLLHEWTPTNPGGLDADTFSWQLDPHGGCVNLQLNGRNDTLGIPPRGVVALTVDGAAQFHGIAPDVPSAGSPDAEAVIVAGGSEALRVTLMDGTVYRNQGVYTIARDILARLCPPALVYSAAQIGDGSGTDTGPILDTFYSPTAPLAPDPDTQQKGVLAVLAESAKVPWGVDAQGRPFLGRPAAAPLAVAYAGQPWRRLPAQGRETCTRAVLRLVSAPSAGAANTGTTINEEYGVAYLPATVTTTALHPTHSIYGASRDIPPPDGVSLVRDSHEGTAIGFQMDTAPALDGDPATGTTATGPRPGIIVRNDTERVVGLRVRYKFTPAEGAFGVVLIQHLGPLDATETVVSVQSAVTFALPESSNTRDLLCIAPPSAEVVTAGWEGTQVQVYTLAPDGATAPADFVVYDLALLAVDEVASQRMAESYLQVPFSTPAELTLPGLIPPSPTVSVTGSPDGDVSGPAGLFVYTLTANDGRQTLVRLGTTGQDQTVRALRWAVRQ